MQTATVQIDFDLLRICYADHYVQLNREPSWSDKFCNSYLKDMRDELTEIGSADAHMDELGNANNDGSWSVHALDDSWSLKHVEE